MTDLKVETRSEAIQKIQWYALRWKIETFHKILKSGCKAEESKLRAAERLVRLISLLCILSWRTFWLTMINRTAKATSPKLVFTQQEMDLLDCLIVKDSVSKRNGLSRYIKKVARLGGYLARANDPPPGNQVLWRGMSRLTDIQLGFEIGRKFVGN